MEGCPVYFAIWPHDPDATGPTQDASRPDVFTSAGAAARALAHQVGDDVAAIVPVQIVRVDARGLVTTLEAAQLLGVRPKTIRRYIAAGRLEAVQLVPRGVYKIRAADVLGLLTADQGNRR